MTVRRVGIVAKHDLVAASEHVSRLARGWEPGASKRCTSGETAALGRRSRSATRHDSQPRRHCRAKSISSSSWEATARCSPWRRESRKTGRDVPILGVNFGSLGFLTEIRIDELMPSLEGVISGTAAFDERAMLAADAYRNDTPVDARVVLNDVVFTKAAISRMIELSVSVSGGFVTRVKADGLIIASATGSTAYNLAAGGPIVHPRVDALVLTPIAPHTLTNRPVVIPGSAEVEVRPHAGGPGDDVFVTYDGQSGYTLNEGDVVRVRKSDRMLRLVKAPTRGYFEVLREKLKWGER